MLGTRSPRRAPRGSQSSAYFSTRHGPFVSAAEKRALSGDGNVDGVNRPGLGIIDIFRSEPKVEVYAEAELERT